MTPINTPSPSKTTDSEPPTTSSLIVNTLKLRRATLLQGHFERAVMLANQLQTLSLSFNEPSAQGLALAIQGLAHLMTDKDTEQGPLALRIGGVK